MSSAHAPSTAPGPAALVPVSAIRADPLGFLAGLAERYGDLTRHRTEQWEVYVVNRPDLAGRVLRELRRHFSKSGTPDDQMLSPLLGKGLLTSEGEHWKRQRRLAQPAFTPRRVLAFDTIMTTAALDLAARLQPAAADGTPVRLDHELTGLALTVVARALLGADMSGVGGRFGEAVDTVNRFMCHYEPMAPTQAGARARAEYAAALRFLDQIVHLLVAGRRAAPAGGDDLLDRLLAARDATGNGFSPRELRDQVITMLMAGHETTAKALTWTMYLLDLHPEVKRRLHEELDTVLGGRPPTAEDLPRLALTGQVIQESMRLYPPVWLMSRRAVDAVELGGYLVPAGSLVCISPYTLHRHPGHWPDPERFLPERFAPEAVRERHPYAYLPFSDGPRKCIGHAFASTEAVLALATLCARLDFRLVPGHPVEPEALVTLRPREGLLVTVHPRP